MGLAECDLAEFGQEPSIETAPLSGSGDIFLGC
jgi:hypothetical protein